MHIVVCEDDEEQTLILKEYFREYQEENPYTKVSFFSSGEELLQKISELSTIHFAILDI